MHGSRYLRWFACRPVTVGVLTGGLVLAACSSSPQPNASQTTTSTSRPLTTRPSTPSTTSTQAPGVSPPAIPTGVVLGLDTSPANEQTAIAQLGKTPAIINFFYQWEDNNGNYVAYPQSWVDSTVQMGATPMITWQPSAGTKSAAKSTNQPQFNLATILSGKYDSFIRQWATSAKSDNKTLYLRLMHEMNDSVYAWGAGVNGNTPAQYVSAFQHIVNIFRSVGANNVQFIWCIGANKLTPNPSVYFPGDNYVSWVSIDGYNHDKPWKSFADIFSQPYQDVTSISNRPVMIAETGTVEDPTNAANKASWITTALTQTIPTQFPRIKAVMYFDIMHGGKYAIDTSPEALAAIKQVYDNPLYQATAPTTTLSY
jgi:beta-mannanase